MPPQSDWSGEFSKEITHALSARANGNEGMARVCARRAAGIVIGEYLRRQGFQKIKPSAYDRLTLFCSLPNMREQTRKVVSHFLMRVDHDRHLPVDADLVDEAQWLASILLLENIN